MMSQNPNHFQENVSKGMQKTRELLQKVVAELIKRMIKKILVALVKAIVKAIVKIITLIVGAIVAVIGPVAAVILLVIVIIGGIILVVSPDLGWLGFVDDPPRTKEEVREEYETLIEESSSIEQYRPPFKLVTAIDSIRIVKNDLDPYDTAPKPIVNELKPDIKFKTYKDTYKVKKVKKWTTVEPKDCENNSNESSESNDDSDSKEEDCGNKLVPHTDTDYSTKKADRSLIKDAHAWNEDVTYYYQEVSVDDEYEKVDSYTEDGKSVTEYKKKTHEWKIKTVNRNDNYEKFDSVLNRFKFTDEDVTLLLESLKTNNIHMDCYMGDFFDSFLKNDVNMLVPYDYMPIYNAAEKQFDVNWYVLAAIHYVESDFKESLDAKEVLDKDISIYESDGNDDGELEPRNNLEDSIFTVAKYLSLNGYTKKEDDVRSSIRTYNDEQAYVDKVWTHADKFKTTSGTIPSESKGKFMRPAVGPITSGFGMRWGDQHPGVDIGRVEPVVPIVAAADGKVTRSYKSSTYGQVVFIEHHIDGQVYETVYAHMVRGSRRVKVNDPVSKGQVIGLMGSTGLSTGPHLHFEIHVGGHWNFQKSLAKDPLRLGLIQW